MDTRLVVLLYMIPGSIAKVSQNNDQLRSYVAILPLDVLGANSPLVTSVKVEFVWLFVFGWDSTKFLTSMAMKRTKM